MRGTMWKTTLREIRQSLGRYIAILAIVALGVGLFSGLKITKPLMIETADQYLTEKNLYDFQLVSTYGFEQEDVDYLAAREEVRALSGAYTYDVLYQYAGEDNTMVMKVHTLTEGINELRVRSGRLPQNAGECIVDSDVYGEDAIGQTIRLTDMNKEDTLDSFAVREFTITGVADASNYIQFERGNTSIGSGKVNGFMYVLPEAFDSEIYTEILVKFQEDFVLYSEEYDTFIEEKEDAWEAYADESAEQRFARIQADAYEELADARKELEEEKADAQAELDDAKVKLEDARKEIADGKAQLADGKVQLADGKKEIERGKKEIADGWTELREKEKTLTEGGNLIAENKAMMLEKEQALADGIAVWNENKALADANKQTLEAGMRELEKKEAELAAGEAQFAAGTAELAVKEQELADGEAQLEQMERLLAQGEAELEALKLQLEQGMIPEEQRQEMEALLEAKTAELTAGKAQLALQKEGLEAGKLELAAAKEMFAAMEEQLVSGRTELTAGKAQLTAALAQMEEAEAELDAAWAVLEDGQKQLESGKAQLASEEAKWLAGKDALNIGIRTLEEAEAELDRGERELTEQQEVLAEAEAELADGEKEYLDGLKEYEDGLAEFETEIAEAEAEIADAEQEILDMEAPECYVLGRDTNVGYVCLDNDSSIVADVADVFPVFFFLIAALVCMTTMNRMIEEQRTQIGILKALGYSSRTIMGKYLFYSGSAAGIGCVLGYFIGTFFLSKIIWMAYGMMYNVGSLTYFIDWPLAVVSFVCSMLCSMGVTWFSCHVELNEVAASLMRPKAPKAGKRVFLEYIPFIWKRLSFLVKVSIRNVFRYKKRFFMMIIGISGSMALLVTGFGIQDSISDVVTMQYDEIQKYHMSAAFRNVPDEEELDALAEVMEHRVSQSDLFMEGSLDLSYQGNTKSVSMVVPKRPETFGQYIDLHTLDGAAVAYPEKGEVVVSHKICENFGIQIGDTIQLMDEDHNAFEVKVSGICQNFVSNYIFLHPDTCTDQWKVPEFKTVYMNVLSEETDLHLLSADLMALDGMSNVVVNADVKERFDNMMATMDYLVMVIIFCAAALAFIVLYNLTNINITERIREIATIKVLGFYKNETASYVFRENVALTAVGSFAGLFLGKIFHGFVMSCINIDMVAFDVRIKPVSYGYSMLLTFVFAWLVNKFMSGKLEKISMTESLKSVD